MKTYTSFTFIIVIILSGILNIILIAYLFLSPHDTQKIEQSYVEYPFLSKRIFLENQNDLLINFVNLRTELTTYMKGVKNRTGIYFEYLPTGTSIGINDKENFIFASLLKVPVVIAVYEQIDKGNLSHDDVLTVKDQYIDASYGDFWKKGVGTKASVQELIKLSLIQSDNTASNTLFGALPPGAVDKVFDTLDIPKNLQHNAPVVTPKNYASILRSLYLSAILSKNHSNEILSFMTESVSLTHPNTAFHSIPVAHKIGVYGIGSETNWIYSDCGIYYPSKRPYILCIMTEANTQTAEGLLTDISSLVYTYVTKQNTQ